MTGKNEEYIALRNTLREVDALAYRCLDDIVDELYARNVRVSEKSADETPAPTAPVNEDLDKFRYVNVTTKGCEGWLNLFYDGGVLCLVNQPDMAYKIRQCCKKLDEE